MPQPLSTAGSARQIIPRRLILALALSILPGASAAAGILDQQTSTYAYVITHHYDNARTGWNSQELILNPSNVNAQSFGLLYTVSLDDQVDAQPLVLSVPLPTGRLDVAYVATESNTVYTIDADNGTVLLKRNLGTPVPQSALPGGCNNNAPNIGINSTPVIDLTSDTLYLITYTMENGQQVYRIHALDLTTLQDKVGTGVVVTASQTLSNGQTYAFNAAVSGSGRPWPKPTATFMPPLAASATSRAICRAAGYSAGRRAAWLRYRPTS